MTATLTRMEIRALDGVTRGVLTDDPYAVESLTAYVEAGGYRDVHDLPARLATVDLRGRGGAAFPVARKLASVLEQPGQAVVVANGEEGEPGSVKDRYLMLHRPHLVLDGLRLMARETGAARAYVYVADPDAAQVMTAALDQSEAFWDIPVEVFRVAHTYVAGEESSLVRAINGGPALPTAKPPRAFERGVGDAPTLVQNVETLAHVARVAAGSTASTFLATVTGGGLEPALLEVPFGTRLRSLVGLTGDLRGVLAGGLFGGLLRDAWDTPLTHHDIRSLGSGLGCGSFALLGPDDCPVDAAADAVTYLSAESARQCGVCINATSGMAEVLAGLRAGTTSRPDVVRMEGWTQKVPGRGACALVDAAARTAASLLREFPDEVTAHLDSPCSRCAALGPLPRNTRNYLEIS